MAARLPIFRIVALALLLLAAADLVAEDLFSLSPSDASASSQSGGDDACCSDHCFCCCAHSSYTPAFAYSPAQVVTRTWPPADRVPPAGERDPIYHPPRF